MLLSSCRPPDRLTARPSGTDSAGISIVESTAPVWAAGRGWSVADSPTVEIAKIGSPMGAVRLSDGRIVVADGRPSGLRYFSRGGDALYEVGRAGEGPGELRSIYRLDRIRGDTVVVYDLSQRRLVFIDPNGALALAVSVAESLTPPGANGYLPKGVASDGRYLFQRDEVAFPFAGAEGSLVTDSTRILWLSRAGTFTDSTPRLVAGELFGFSLRAERDRRVLAPLARPLAPALRVAAGADVVWTGDGASWEIRGVDEHGWLTRILRIRRERPLLTPAFRDSFVARFRIRAAASGVTAIQRQFADGMGSAPFPERLAAFGDLLAGQDSTLWAQHVGLVEGLPGDGSLVWTVFDPAGRWSGEVTMPPRFRPTAVGHGWILGIWRDATDVPRVRLYPLVEH
ncbi:MAG: hypothetical protein ABIQ41_04155 [Gemmatimonadales bacterium]